MPSVTEEQSRRVVSIVGPTASGKTGLGIAIAKALASKGERAEIVNADAYQMYRGMDIGTAKASAEERAQVRHHLIDIIDPDDAMSVARFQELAREKITELQGRAFVRSWSAVPACTHVPQSTTFRSPAPIRTCVTGWRNVRGRRVPERCSTSSRPRIRRRRRAWIHIIRVAPSVRWK